MILTDIEALKYNEALGLPKFKASLDRLLNKKCYDLILTCSHHTKQDELRSFVDKAINEGNAVLIQREYCGYCVILWKD